MTVTSNNTYDIAGNGYRYVNVNVPSSSYSSGSKTFTSNGTYYASSYGYDGFSSVTVNVSSSGKSLSDICSGIYGGWYFYHGSTSEINELKFTRGIAGSVSSGNAYGSSPNSSTGGSSYHATWTTELKTVTTQSSGYYMYFINKSSTSGASVNAHYCTFENYSSGQTISTYNVAGANWTNRIFVHFSGLNTSVFGPNTKIYGAIAGGNKVVGSGGFSGNRFSHWYNSSGYTLNGLNKDASALVDGSVGTSYSIAYSLGFNLIAMYSGYYMSFVNMNGPYFIAIYKYCGKNDIIIPQCQGFVVFYLGT